MNIVRNTNAMKEIAFFVDAGREYQVSNVIKILSLNKARTIKIINREKWQGYNFKNCSIVITTESIGSEIAAIMQRARDAGVPSLTIQEGIVEYEHCWEKRLDSYRPLITDRIAVFGNFTKQILMSWGISENRIDVVGCPRFDTYSELINIRPKKPAILLTCANTPYVDEKTKQEFRLSFIDVAKELESSGVDFFIRLNKRKTLDLFMNEPVIIKKLHQNQNSITNRILKKLHLGQRTIAQDISAVSAVITSISTVALEAMAMGRTVAILNYSGETVYHRTPWEISTPNHIKTVIQELLNPPSPKMLFQSQLFNEYVYYEGSASKRIVDVINKMIIN